MSSNGAKKKLLCGHDDNGVWMAVNKQCLLPLTEVMRRAGIFEPPDLGLRVMQCRECKLIVGLDVIASQPEKKIVQPTRVGMVRP